MAKHRFEAPQSDEAQTEETVETVPNPHTYETGYQKRQRELQEFLGDTLLNGPEIVD